LAGNLRELSWRIDMPSWSADDTERHIANHHA
jgi:hypothetical protein